MRYLTICLFWLVATISVAQISVVKPGPAHHIYVEGLGSGIVYSINYEYSLLRMEQSIFNLRIGGSFLPAIIPIYKSSFLIGGSYLIGKSKEYLELGANYLTIYGAESESSSYPGFVIGYRYIPSWTGFTFRASFTPFYTRYLLNPNSTFPITPYAGISLGYAF